MKTSEIKYSIICILIFIASIFWSGTIDPAQLCFDHWALYSIMTVGAPVVVWWNRDKKQ